MCARGSWRCSRALASQRPVTLLFEDAHTLRPQMLDLIERIAARGRQGPGKVLVLVAARTELLEERPAWGTAAMNQVRVRLEPLPEGEAAELARQAGGGRLDDAQAATVVGRAGGNPFFIVESTGMLLREGPSKDGEPLIPPTVKAMVASRLDSLPFAQRDLARRLSVYQYDFDLEEVGVVADAGERELHELIDAEIIVREENTASSPVWRFRQEVLRDVAYASLPKRERQRSHTVIAERLRAAGALTWAADHLEAAALAARDLDPTDREPSDRAADALVAAGDRARRRMESRSALDLYLRALAMVGPEDRWAVREARALAGIGEARYWLSEYAEATEVLERAIELGTRARRRLDARDGAAFPRGRGDQRGCGSGRRRGDARAIAGRRGAFGRAVGDRALAVVPRVGPVDPRRLRCVRRHLAARPRDRARRARTGGPRCAR